MSLKKRAEFLAIRQSGTSIATAGMIVQARPTPKTSESDTIRLGLTTSRKLGNAVVRNRSRRRLREVAKKVLPELGRAGYDYVLIGRSSAYSRDYTSLIKDLRYALHQIHRQ